jgi:hypothetical protein
MVVTMAMLECAFYLLGLVAVGLAFLSRWYVYLVYLNALILLIMLYLQIAVIPLNLNWSRNSYGYLLKRLFVFVFFTALVYALHYHFAGITSNGVELRDFTDALYFSFTTWTTLGYGDVTTIPELRLATSLEALTGLLTTAIVTSMVWLFCQEGLWKKSADTKQELPLRLDDALGAWREIDSAETARQREERNRKLRLRPCKQCGKTPSIEKFYDIVGRSVPFANFVVLCECGEQTKPRKNAFLAAYTWNRRKASDSVGK